MEAVCKRCLLKDLQEDEYIKQVYEYIESLPDEIKADTALFQERLELCRVCNYLVNGMCKICGCFVEVRAAKKAQQCPGSVSRW